MKCPGQDIRYWKPGAIFEVKCPKCGLAKDSPGCCKIPEGAQIAALCTMCDKVIVEKACCGCYDGKCPVEEFAQTHRYPSPKETK